MKPPPIHVPVTSGERIASLDVLRGFALLGVLVMNMQLFSMIEASLMNPAAFGDFTGINRIVWITTYLFGDLKFMANFSMLFGAGILLMTQRAEARTGKSAGLHYQRMFWLMMIGMVHAYVFWYGDILVSYAVTGMAVYLLRRLPARWLLGLGAVALVPPSLLFLFCQLTLPWWSPESLSEILAEWQPNSEQVASELAAYRGGWWAQTAYRAPSSLMAQVFLIPFWAGWRAGGMMLIGMALLKSGVLTAERSKRFYMVPRLPVQLLGQCRRGVGLPGDHHVDGEERGPAVVAGRPIRDGENGPEQLPFANAGLHHPVLWARVRIVRLRRPLASTPHRPCHSCRADGRLAGLAALVPLRPDGVAVAIAELSALAAVALIHLPRGGPGSGASSGSAARTGRARTAGCPCWRTVEREDRAVMDIGG